MHQPFQTRCCSYLGWMLVWCSQREGGMDVEGVWHTPFPSVHCPALPSPAAWLCSCNRPRTNLFTASIHVYSKPINNTATIGTWQIPVYSKPINNSRNRHMTNSSLQQVHKQQGCNRHRTNPCLQQAHIQHSRNRHMTNSSLQQVHKQQGCNRHRTNPCLQQAHIQHSRNRHTTNPVYRIPINNTPAIGTWQIHVQGLTFITAWLPGADRLDCFSTAWLSPSFHPWSLSNMGRQASCPLSKNQRWCIKHGRVTTSVTAVHSQSCLLLLAKPSY